MVKRAKTMFSDRDMAYCFAHLHLKMEGELHLQQLKAEVAG